MYQQQQEAASDEAQQSRHDVTHPPCDSPSCLYHLILIRYSAHLQTMQIPRRATCGPISAPLLLGAESRICIYIRLSSLCSVHAPDAAAWALKRASFDEAERTFPLHRPLRNLSAHFFDAQFACKLHSWKFIQQCLLIMQGAGFQQKQKSALR